MAWKVFKVLFVLGVINCEATRGPIVRNLRALTNLVKIVQSLPNVQKGVISLQEHLKHAAPFGVMLGAVKVEKAMEINLMKLISDFQKSLQRSDPTGARKKHKEIETTMERDKHAIEILMHAMALATKTKNISEYREALNKLAAKDSIGKNQKIEPKPPKRFDDVKASVKNHMKIMQEKVDAAIKQAIESMEIKTKKKTSQIVSTSPAITSPNIHMNDIYNRDTVRLPPLYVQMPVWLPGYNIDVESFYRFRRQNDLVDNQIENSKEKTKESEEEFDDDDLGNPSSNGGIGGLIASLSGGEGGSDVGALVGAISGVITNLFGPGGLDIPSLISTGSSLIAGLLAGDENFGKVLGNYIGLAVEGFSGGGAADLNGEFFGNFVGTLFASLSADPEDEEESPKPKIFFDNFFKGFEQSKQKRGADNETSNPKGYFFEFLSNIISSLVGGITNLILNSSLGSSGGSSQGSADLSAGSSQGSHTGSAAASMGSMQSEAKPHPKK